MNKVQISVMSSAILKMVKIPFQVSISDSENILHAIAKADLQLFEKTNGKFPIEDLKSMLQLIYDPESGEFYDDVGIDVRDESKKYINIRKDPTLELHNNIIAIFTPDAGC
ncbi:MAG: hypothetical protein ACTSPY_10960 [Candidatus Helarchaeota archaeon]